MERFEKVINRKGSSSVKWDLTKTVFGEEDVLPMWVADMDFPPPNEVIADMQNRLDHGLFGYTFVGDGVATAIASWMNRHHQWRIQKNWLLYSPGVVPAISTLIQSLTEEGDKVLLQSPIYTPFFDMIEQNNRVVENCPLVYENGHYYIDFEALETSLQSGVKLFLLCNPHNPSGRVWTREELTKIGDLCLANDVIIVSDEIHSDLVFKPNKHVPIASIRHDFQDQTITCIAPSKTFNLAGLQASSMIISNATIRNRISEFQKKQGFFTLNTFGIIGMESAYNKGDDWLSELLHYLKQNIDTVINHLSEKLPQVKVVDPHATYLIWLDCRALGYTDTELNNRLLQKGKLALEPGTKYGKGGEGFLRMNIACPHTTLLEGLDRFVTALQD